MAVRSTDAGAPRPPVGRAVGIGPQGHPRPCVASCAIREAMSSGIKQSLLASAVTRPTAQVSGVADRGADDADQRDGQLVVQFVAGGGGPTVTDELHG